MPPVVPKPHTIEDEGNPLGFKPKLNFVGAGVHAYNAGNKTVIEIAGGPPGPQGPPGPAGGASSFGFSTEWYVAVDADPILGSRVKQSFADAIAACTPRDIIYICSDLNENLNINVQDVSVVGVGGHRIINGTGSSIADRTVNIDFGAHYVRLENLWIRGNAGFKGVHLCCNVANHLSVSNVRIDGTGGSATATNYGYASPASPYTQSTGIGGIGVLFHQSEHAHLDHLEVGDCSIGIALGTWSTQIRIENVVYGANAQHFVEGLHSGANGSPARTTAFGWSQGAVANSHVGDNTYIGWQAAGAVNTGTMPVAELVGDGTVNYVANGGHCTFINVNISEGGAVTPTFRIGTSYNKFVNCTCPGGNEWVVDGQNNVFDNLLYDSMVLVKGAYNTFNNPLAPSPSPGSGWIQSTGNYNTFTNATLYSVATVPVSHTGTGNRFERCTVETMSGPVPTRAAFGTSPMIVWSEGSYTMAYGPTVGVAAHVPTGLLNVTDGAAFTIANPVDPTNPGDINKILCTTPIRLIFTNGSGGAHGQMNVGSKYRLQGGGTVLWPAGTIANGKRRVLEVFYDPAADVFVETGRSTADVG